jgi:glutamyl/glutaminyl-tRNA synthetase
VDLKCPVCGHLVGQEEYERVRANFDRLVSDKAAEATEEIGKEIGQLTNEIYTKDQEVQDKEKQIRDMQEQHQRDVERLADEKAASRIEKIRKQLEEESRISKDDEIQCALTNIERKFAIKEQGYKLQIQRAEKKNGELTALLENIPPERKGTAGEIVLYEELAKRSRMMNLS